MDFYKIRKRLKKGVYEVAPEFGVEKSKDLMIKGEGNFYAFYDEESGMWTQDKYHLAEVIDADIREYMSKIPETDTNTYIPLWAGEFSTKTWTTCLAYISSLPDNFVLLDSKLTFSNTVVTKEDYVSKRLPYPLEEGSIDAYDKLMNKLYAEKEREKIEWAIGSIIAGEAKDIQKFIVLYGKPGSGKGTVINILLQLFKGYTTTFDAKKIASANNRFAADVFRDNPLVAIQHDGDLSRIEDNTVLNSIVSHEIMSMEEKNKPSYPSRVNAFLFLGSNTPVKISDGKSGLLRRLIDVSPTGELFSPEQYDILMSQVNFERGAIAWHCLQVYKRLGKNYYSHYRPTTMIYKTDAFFNFMDYHYYDFKKADGVSVSNAYIMYKNYIDLAGEPYKLPRRKFSDELGNYFREFKPIARIDGQQVRSYYSGFKTELFSQTERQEEVEEKAPEPVGLILDSTTSLLDELYKECKAQYTNPKTGTPRTKWAEVSTTLAEINTAKEHMVKPPYRHVVIDFDLKDETGEKSAELNLKAASLWPLTYAEFSRGGKGIHLHYIYDGDLNKLKAIHSPGIEIKVFNGNASLRRRLSYCNNVPVAHLMDGSLPYKEEKVIDTEGVKNEQHLRARINLALKKQIHPDTTSNVNYIKHVLYETYESGMEYDVSDLKGAVTAFAAKSTHQASTCLTQVAKMHFCSKKQDTMIDIPFNEEAQIVFFDVEVFPNLCLVVWKFAGPEEKCVKLFNPSPIDITNLLQFRLIGFNNRKYDNHILYAILQGYTPYQIYEVSKKIINKESDAFFAKAYNLSYTDIYDFSSAQNKKSLKKWEIELDIDHVELGMEWDKDAPEEMWETIGNYCENDVLATEAVFNCKDIQGDWSARLGISELSGLSPNTPTNTHSAKIIFGDNREPQDQFNYVDLSQDFPGYKYNQYGRFDKSEYTGKTVSMKSWYKGIDPGEGGRVFSKPGIYYNVALLDIASMHPSSIIALNLFGDVYTKRFKDIVEARLAIKHRDYEKLKNVFDGAFVKYIGDDEKMDAMSLALKTVINSIYGLTKAGFKNAFRDPRNIDNIVAKRGALFMIDLQEVVEGMGYEVVHVKTDSIKIANADDNIIQFVMEYGLKWGYTFEHEATYERMCLLNDAEYIAKYGFIGKHPGEWTPTGDKFKDKYTLKTLFTKEHIEFKDLCVVNSVQTAIYLDFNELGYPDVTKLEADRKKLIKAGQDTTETDAEIAKGHNYQFIGKVGSFVPVKPGTGGGLLRRTKDEAKGVTGYDAVNGSSGYRWMESAVVKTLGKESIIDLKYYNDIANAVVEEINKLGGSQSAYDEFVMSGYPPCGTKRFETCVDCPRYKEDKCKAGYALD